MGQTLDMFQQSENTPVCRDWLNREQNGSGNSTENSRRILLLIPSGPMAFPTGRDFKTASISAGVKVKLRN